MNDQRRIQTFSEFYPYYLKEHSRKATRIAHFLATGLALGLAGMAKVLKSQTIE